MRRTVLECGKIVLYKKLFSAGAVSYFQPNETPDLIFCDIQLGDGLSFEIFNKIPVSSPVVVFM